MNRIKNIFDINNCRGYTLSEVLVSVFIFVLLATASYTIMASSSSSWQVNRVWLQLQQDLRKTQNWMTSELRQSGSVTITDALANGNVYNAITFRTSTGVSGGAVTWSANTIQYSLSGTQLQRVSGGTTRVIAQNISLLQIRRQVATPNLVEVTVQAQRSVPSAPTITANLSFKVQLRN